MEESGLHKYTTIERCLGRQAILYPDSTFVKGGGNTSQAEHSSEDASFSHEMTR